MPRGFARLTERQVRIAVGSKPGRRILQRVPQHGGAAIIEWMRECDGRLDPRDAVMLERKAL